jgi:hypothetical protein
MLITGYEVTPFKVSEILPFIAYSSPTKKASPVIIAAMTPYIIPLGAETYAFWVSSDIYAAASYPLNPYIVVNNPIMQT